MGDFRGSGTRQNSDTGLLRIGHGTWECLAAGCRAALAHLFRGRVSDECASVAIPGIVIRLEGEDTQYLIAQPRYSVDSSAFPRPHFRRDIIDDPGIRQVLAAESRHAEVERGIIDQDQHIGLFLQ